MTSIIKVDNIQDQCGSAVVTKCGASKTLTVTTAKANNYQAADGGNIINQCGTTITLGASGDNIVLACGASQSGFGRTGTVDWDTTAKTASFTAVSGNGYFVNTTSGAITVTLPATPSAGDIVAIADYNGTATTNPITIGRNSSNINGDAADFTISINYGAISFVYVDATAGWRSVDTSDTSSLINPFVSATGGTITTCGDFKTHVFTGPGTFTVTNTGAASGSNSVEYLVVAGGGGGGKSDVGGGGGAGGYRQNYPSPTAAGLPVTAQGYPITVGSGGAGESGPIGPGTSGSNSIFSTITSTGGGGGGGTPNAAGLSGGSGGGGAHGGTGGAGGSGNTPPTSPSQGNNGGSGNAGAPIYGGGGGGGASAVGTNGSASVVAPGGAGSPIATAFFGPTSPSYGTPGPAPGRYFAGGGGGARDDAGTGGAGGAGGGGAGGSSDQDGVNGTTNTGGGGGGTADQPATSGAGGSGIVIIRYKYQ